MSLFVQGTFRNITERKKYEEVKENYRRDLEASIKERTIEIEEQLEMAESAREAMLNILDDVTTARKELERLAEFPTRTPLPVVEVNEEGIVTYFNQSAHELIHHLKLDEAHAGEILPGDYKSLVKHAIKTGVDIRQTEIKLGRRVFLWTGHPIPSLNLVHFYASDISMLKTAEEKLIHAKEMAEASNRLKTIFIGTISHEIRTPLNTILGYADLLANDLKNKLSEEEVKLFQIVKRSGDRLKNMVDDILDVSQIEADRIITKLNMVHADTLISNCIQEIEIQATQKKLYVKKELNGNTCGIQVDQGRFQQAFGNVLQNGIKYTPKGGLTIKTWADDNTYHISVTDTGVGISEEFLPHVFTLFRQQEEGFTRKYEGAGLGAYISYRFIKAMGGTINVESELDVGSTFTISFPIGEKMFVDKQIKDKQTADSAKTQKRFNHILVVEDNEANMNYIKYLLKKLNISHVTATSGEEALKVLETNTVDCMLVDISLAGGISGVDFMKLVRKQDQYKKTAIIAVTAHTMKGMRENLIKEGFDDHLPKPYTLSDLKNILEQSY